MISFITRHILTGLIAVLPVLLTLYLLYWFVVSTEAILGEMIQFVLPEALYRPGMGVAAGLILVFMIGLLMHIYVVQRLFSSAQQVLYHTPLVNSIYRAINDFFHYFSASKEKDFEQVVAVTIGNNMQLVGFVTQALSEELPEGLGDEDSILVYFPLSYMIGGYAVVMPRHAVQKLDMTMEEAMRFTLTAGVAGKATD